MPHGEKGFWVFFNEIMQGKLIERTAKCAFLNENQIIQIQEKISETTRNFTQEINQSVYQNSEIIIRCGSEDTYLKNHQLLHRKQEYDPHTGDLVKGTGCLTYGCCFNVTQNTKISLHAINEAETKDINKLENDISTAISAETALSGQDCPPGGEVKKTTNNITIVTQNREIIKEIIEQSKLSSTNISQKIILNYDEPLFCVNRCNETPSAGEIKQISNVDIMTRNMVKSVAENIEKNVREAKIRSEMKLDYRDPEKNKTMLWCAYSAAIVVIAFYICKFLAKMLILLISAVGGPGVIKVVKKILDSPVGFLLITPIAGFLLYLTWRLWKFGWCWHISPDILRKVLCFWDPIIKIVAFIPCPVCNWIKDCKAPCPIPDCPDSVLEFCDCVDTDCTNTTIKCPSASN